MRAFWLFIFPFVGVVSSCLTGGTNGQIDQQYVKDTTSISSFLKQNNIAATKLPQGIWFVVDSAASGIHTTFNDSVKLKYTTRLLDNGSVVDQSSTLKYIQADSLITGVKIALPQFPTGSKGRIFIPTSYSMGYKNVKTLANLIFEFQLIDVQDHQLKLDTAIIDAYLKAHSIKNVLIDGSGLRYTIDTLKTGAKPKLTDQVQVNYTAKNLSDGTVVDQGFAVSLPLTGLILGWQIGLQQIQAGSTFTLYVPSSLAYGPGGNGAIAANTNLVFTIQLLKVIPQ